MTLTEETPVDTIRESAPPNSSLTQLFSGIISDCKDFARLRINGDNGGFG